MLSLYADSVASFVYIVSYGAAAKYDEKSVASSALTAPAFGIRHTAAVRLINTAAITVTILLLLLSVITLYLLFEFYFVLRIFLYTHVSEILPY